MTDAALAAFSLPPPLSRRCRRAPSPAVAPPLPLARPRAPPPTRGRAQVGSERGGCGPADAREDRREDGRPPRRDSDRAAPGRRRQSISSIEFVHMEQFQKGA
ncbi:uncharacterized protein LOC132541277 isoform X3 [Erinaceus europaeus]|uniref:Uncharacterized protein LOC132541277 isoform X3 n=1 Tax=Erinaceus europaeus TaxID=9365 RepID=A0ABM3Y7H3_ERIEU|nr:uncharacterized protein LOC132541277 isoform X3 [Erinaceus europaeus]